MILWYAYQVREDGSRCLGELWADDATQAYALAVQSFQCRIDFVSRRAA